MPRHRSTLALAPTTSETDEDLLNLIDAARRLGVRPDTLKKMAQRREIPSIKYGKLRRFEPAALRAYIAAHRQG